MRALTPLRSKIRRRNDGVVHDSGRLVASSVFDAALCSRSISHNPHADEHDPSACGGQLLIVSPDIMTLNSNLMVIVTRDSVCAGDDVDAPHEVSYVFDSATSKDDILKAISRKTVDTQYPEQKWVCVWNGIDVAEYQRSGCAIDLDKIVLSNVNAVHFKYVWIRDQLE